MSTCRRNGVPYRLPGTNFRVEFSARCDRRGIMTDRRGRVSKNLTQRMAAESVMRGVARGPVRHAPRSRVACADRRPGGVVRRKSPSTGWRRGQAAARGAASAASNLRCVAVRCALAARPCRARATAGLRFRRRGAGGRGIFRSCARSAAEAAAALAAMRPSASGRPGCGVGSLAHMSGFGNRADGSRFARLRSSEFRAPRPEMWPRTCQDAKTEAFSVDTYVVTFGAAQRPLNAPRMHSASQ